MEKNHTRQVLSFVAMVLLLLTGLSVLPGGMQVGDFTLRKMDIFSDIRVESSLADASDTPALPSDSLSTSSDSLLLLATDSLQMQDTVYIIPAKDSAYFGKILEDYTPNQRGMSRFFAAVDSIRQGRTVRVAWYGDSFVEGDILIGDLRDSLQSTWGGAGVGFVPITSEVAQFKRSLKHQFKGWTAYSILKKSENRPNLGLNGYAYQPEAEAKVHYEGASYFQHTRRWNQVRLFYTAETPCNFVWQANEEGPKMEKLNAKPDGKLSVWQWNGTAVGTDAFTIRFPEPNNLLAYGVSLENGPGIYIDNFSIRGNSGGPLKSLRPDFIQQFDAVQQYDLVVLQVGLNAVTDKLNNIRWYEAELDRTFKHLRTCFPDKPILIISVGDRDGKVGTEILTMRGVPAIVAMQRDMARKHGFLFYDLFWGMGGPETMLKFANQRPRLANTDYTHLTHEGGKVVGLQFARLMLLEQQKWKISRPSQ